MNDGGLEHLKALKESVELGSFIRKHHKPIMCLSCDSDITDDFVSAGLTFTAMFPDGVEVVCPHCRSSNRLRQYFARDLRKSLRLVT